MDSDIRTKLAALLRAAAAREIPEDDFWQQFSALAKPFEEPAAGVAFETATHYWGNFHERNILFIPAKPDKYQVIQGQNELKSIADGLEKDWPVFELKQKLQNI